MSRTRVKLIVTYCLFLLSLVLGGYGFVRVASAWTNPPGVPTTCPSGYAGCDAPINVTQQLQNKPNTISGSTSLTLGGKKICLEDGTNCSNSGNISLCGNGLLDTGESCDDGANSWLDGNCAADCSLSNTITLSTSENGGVWATTINGNQLCKEVFPGKNWIMVGSTKGSTWDWYYAGFITSTNTWNTNCRGSGGCSSSNEYFSKVWCGPSSNIKPGDPVYTTR